MYLIYVTPLPRTGGSDEPVTDACFQSPNFIIIVVLLLLLLLVAVGVGFALCLKITRHNRKRHDDPKFGSSNPSF
jgi:hypothetical protein